MRDESNESEDTERGEMGNGVNQNINGVDGEDVIENVVDYLVFYQRYK